MTTKQTTKQTAQRTGAKTPEDHQEKQTPFRQLEGAEFFKPLEEVDIEDGLDVIGALQDIMGDIDPDDGASDLNVREISGVIRAIRASNVLADPEGFAQFAKLSNLQPVLNVVIRYAEELGKGMS